MKMRKRAAEIVGKNLAVEKVPLKQGGEEVKVRPYAYIPDLWPQIIQLLDSKYTAAVTFQTLITDKNRNGLLCWHDGRLPDDEIWIKIGGDKGGGTFSKITIGRSSIQS